MVRSCFFCWKVSFLPCVPEVFCGLTIVFARLLGLHADSDWTCQRYTFMLVMMFCNGILSTIGWTTSWRCPVWFLLARRWDRLKTQKASLPDELLNACQRIFAAADVEVDDGHLAVCVAVSEFLTESGGCRSGKWGTVTRSEQRMRLLSGGIALWLRRHQ